MSMSDADKKKIKNNLSSLIVHTKWNDKLENALFEKNVNISILKKLNIEGYLYVICKKYLDHSD